MSILNKILAHPLTCDLPVDDPRTTILRRNIIQEKAFLRAIYCEWYEEILSALNKKDDVLELGSGAGFLSNYLPNAITSELFIVPDVKLIADACCLPLPNHSLDAIVMTDVLHHIPDVNLFFKEASRCVRFGGQIVMIEPWRTPWSEWVYTHLHSEPFSPQGDWKIPSTGPLSGANGALPWIIFDRDKMLFEKLYPQWKINNIKLMMPISYLLSGGVSMRSLIPGWLYRPIRALEKLFNKKYCAMFARIELEHIPTSN